MNDTAQILPETNYKSFFRNRGDIFKTPNINWEHAEQIEDRAHLHLYSKKNRKLNINLTNTYSVSLPVQFQELALEIEKSKYIINLPENWDEEGSSQYDEKVFINAIEFLVNYAIQINTKLGIIIDTPKIFHGPEGSIDILWKHDDYNLLANIPGHLDQPGTFYGHDSNKINVIEGKFDFKKSEALNYGLLLWLKQMKIS